jgi:predicted RNA-binding Zn-ribbon protein involved in translation (DUF1610 family)
MLAALILGLASCQTAPKQTSAVAASAPKPILQLTDQKTVYTCPTCGQDYAGPGVCATDKVALVETHVDYICPADNQPVAKAGQCPRCAVNARIVRTAVAAKPSTPAATGS